MLLKREMKSMDGNTAAAYIAYAYNDAAFIYPITPSSTMAELFDKWSGLQMKNLSGNVVTVKQMQSEAGVAGALHGALSAGAVSTTFTSSQGLLLMIPDLYKIAGEFLPCVIQVAARTVASHALSIFGDHSDVYTCRMTGFAMLSMASVQEVMDLSPVGYQSAFQSGIPFLHFFDGFRTSHEIQKIEIYSYEQLREFFPEKEIEQFRCSALNPNRPMAKGQAQNSDLFFQNREAGETAYRNLAEQVECGMEKVNQQIGTNYHIFQYYGHNEAETVFVAMGSVCQTIEETIDYLMNNGEKCGLIQVHLYRPFSKKHFMQQIPEKCQRLIVLDRVKENGALGDPLYEDIVTALFQEKMKLEIYHGRYGLSSKDTTLAHILAAFYNRKQEEFLLGVKDDVWMRSLDESPYGECFQTINDKTDLFQCMFWGMGSDGTVSANKNTIKMIGEHMPVYTQAYFEYDSKKSGGLTISHLRFGSKPIKSAYLIQKADFLACHQSFYLQKYQLQRYMKRKGKFLLNCSEDADLNQIIPNELKLYLIQNEIEFYCIDGKKISEECGLGGKINTVLQAAFFQITNFIPLDYAKQWMKEAFHDTYGKKGEEYIYKNELAMEQGIQCVKKINLQELELVGSDSEKVEKEQMKETEDLETKEYIEQILNPVCIRRGDEVPVSAFVNRKNGEMPLGTSKYEQRKLEAKNPMWIRDNCVQCNLCSFVCPHACIRPVVLNREERMNRPRYMEEAPMKGLEGYSFAIVVDTNNCTGCSLCAKICPGTCGQKALEMEMETEEERKKKWKEFHYAQTLPEKKEVLQKFSRMSVKGSQFYPPLLEFSGACAGCGETGYAKLITQLFGERMYIANATGCSSIWGNSSPSVSYTKNKEGKGPAWANSLFEDNAEFGYGMKIAESILKKNVLHDVDQLEECVKKLEDKKEEDLDLLEKIQIYKKEQKRERKEDADAVGALLEKMIPFLAVHEEDCSLKKMGEQILKYQNFLNQKSVWIFGGDGWAYDIGFGGLDHVLASGENVNVFIFDTEVYSNTGGQVSKATPVGAVAQFASCGKKTKKKKLWKMMMQYEEVYIAQVALGANPGQCLKALKEAEEYEGPSLVIGYAPCINHGIIGGMSCSMEEEKRAVETGYWNLFRYHPGNKQTKAAFYFDSKNMCEDIKEFYDREMRFKILQKNQKAEAENLLKDAIKEAHDKFDDLTNLTGLY